ncbi:FN3 domain-containing metallophosphoesterase family protein [uncultured Alistipes sp.]|jgi:predicted phosphohydrolases|uniref:FN3 domain-containing metallophosphoesterase family protein n=1 Tax=uncultured Alistipes sp. TaxID=538949 RepID=UPI0025E33322|nr:FN3 domain-containing metallophosphoesterase family protein [uncultured Alistipes sp.]
MKRLLTLLGALLLTGIAFGQPSVRIANGPYLQQVTDDGFTVVWTTTMDAASWVEIAPDDGTHFYAAERPKYYDSHIGKRRTGRLHRVRVEGLQPGTTYRYRIMQQGVILEEGNKRVILGEGYGMDILKQKPYTATTLDTKKDKTEFWVVNDIHGRDSVFRLMLKGVEKSKPDLVCFNGDMLSSIESEQKLFDGYLGSASELLTPAGIPIFATRGNHEFRGTFSDRFLDYFPTPTGEAYYTFRQGPVFFLMLDCGEDKPDSDIRYYGLSVTDAYREKEARWLKSVVESEEYRSAPIHIVLLHMIPGGKSSWHGEQELRRLLVPVLNEASVDVMLCGHYHRYSYIDDGSRGTNFPILVNSNNDKLVVKADRKGIDIEVVNTSGEVIKRHRIGK